VIELAPERIAAEAGSDILSAGARSHPQRAVIDSREAGEGDLFFGLQGEHADGGAYASEVLRGGAWGVLVSRAYAEALAADGDAGADGWVLASDDPLGSLQDLARAWARELGCPTVGITGSTGKTSVKDIARAIIPGRVHASPENFNTEIGLPLTILDAPTETEVLVLEMAMRGLGQIAELCEIAAPDVAVITNIGPVHLELLGTIEAIAEAKAEILGGLADGGRAVVPADAEALEPHLADDIPVLTFGPGGDVFAEASERRDGALHARVVAPSGAQDFAFPFGEAHNLANALCAIAIGVALGASLEEMAARAPGITFSRLRGQTLVLAEGILLLNDSYNANPVSMGAALDHLATLPANRRLAVLGEMRELGPDAASYHRDVGAHARRLGIDPVIGVGELAAEYAPGTLARDADEAAALLDAMLQPQDVVLVKGSRAVGLEVVAERLGERRAAGGER
jgi:UDP-N-acetylmuramoyl-tripeptide--D-alanyl-D-alanine ligase